MAAATQITLALRGVDNVSGMLSRVTGRLNGMARAGRATSRGALGLGLTPATIAIGALATAAGLAARQLVRVASEMSNVTDRAADAGTSAGKLQALTQAMSELGVRGASLETVSRAMQEMTRRTGRVGAEGFAEILSAIASVNDAQERAQMLANAFGRQMGASFAPIVAQGRAGVQSFLDLAGAQRVASEEAMANGDRFADTWSRVMFGAKQAAFDFVGGIIGDFRRMFDAMGVSSGDVAATIGKAFKWLFDGIRAAVSVINGVLVSLRAMIDTIAIPLVHVGAAVASAFEGEFSAAVEQIKAIGPAVKDAWRDAADIGGSLFGDDLFGDLDLAGPIRAANDDIGATLADLRKQTAATTSAASSASRQSFASAMGYGSAAAQKFLFGAQSDTGRAQLDAQRQTNSLLSGIDGTLAGLEAI